MKDYATWKAAQRPHSVNTKYWFTEIEMEALYFMLITSVCIGDFNTFLECLKAVLLWFFAHDLTKYSQWMPVFIQVFSTLERDHTETYKAFKKGFFTVRKTNCVFSNMGIDQAHEQKNKILKTDGGVIEILDSPTALLKWTICEPVISEILKEDEDENLPELHHEDTASFEKDFCKDRDSLIASLLEYRNPFEEEEQNLVHITSRHIFDDVATKSVKEVKRIGEDQYTTFVNERLINRHTSLYDMLKRNGLSLFRQKHLLEMSKSKQKMRNKKVSIIAVDTDVVVLALQHFFTLNLEELWIEFGVDKYQRYILIHTCPETFGRKLCSSSTLWHAFTGCDTVSSFNGKVKKTAWKVLRLFDEGLATFAK